MVDLQVASMAALVPVQERSTAAVLALKRMASLARVAVAVPKCRTPAASVLQELRSPILLQKALSRSRKAVAGISSYDSDSYYYYATSHPSLRTESRGRRTIGRLSCLRSAKW
jgi:hypothetical protein